MLFREELIHRWLPCSDTELGQTVKDCLHTEWPYAQGEAESVSAIFTKLGVDVEVIDAQNEFLDALKGITDPEEKREAITGTFYKKVFGRIVRESGARFLLQGTILTDIDETVAGIKRQHNVFAQLGIDPQEAFGYQILEPLVQLRKDGVRATGRALGLPEEMFNRIPFPGPALAARIIGEVTAEKLETVRKATSVVEKALSNRGAFQYMAILHQDRVTGMTNGKRDFGQQIEIRCWDSIDARTATPTNLPFEVLSRLAKDIISEVPGIVSVTYNIATKPPSTIEAVYKTIRSSTVVDRRFRWFDGFKFYGLNGAKVRRFDGSKV